MDSSVWVDHLRSEDEVASLLLGQDQILMHPFVLGELSMGSMKNRTHILHNLRRLPGALVAREDEVESFVTAHSLYGKGFGYLDAHLLVSTGIMAEVTLWTRDKRLHAIAQSLGLAASLPGFRIH
jgi:predicted nucleic acid-binding protein